MANDEHEVQGSPGQGTDASTAPSAESAEPAAAAESEQVEQVRTTERARLHALVHSDLVVADQLHAETSSSSVLPGMPSPRSSI